ncbi:QcrA and Rieske domain-containing protein [Spirosoma foliorum]|uniref:Rieske 2Fe-2S domain-containing protein n=1 Tax=Spirosoma foliorum TaxID=2710596 RepID=A0A7G5H1Y3_9BACT|nr:Rieske (2Fe-2S) protein [Spirosoma foliorum]QMW05125.1 Rieske 2Fe-2S domain-containing protein [Spirosoma foliorum]
METTLPSTDQPTMPRQAFLKLVGTSIGSIILTRSMAGCAGQGSSDPTPDPAQKVDFTLSLNDNANQNLLVKGGYVIVDNVMVVQTKDGKYVAVSAKCTYEGTKLVYKAADNQFYCPLDLSRFDTNGKVVSGPAKQPLTIYIIDSNLTSGTLRVHN